jgi:hypothetical protein
VKHDGVLLRTSVCVQVYVPSTIVITGHIENITGKYYLASTLQIGHLDFH